MTNTNSRLPVTEETHERLKALKESGETWDEMVNRLAEPLIGLRDCNQLESEMNLRTRNEVLERDDHRCQDCGEDDVTLLGIHHIDENRENNSLQNLVTLCEGCHGDRHGVSRISHNGGAGTSQTPSTHIRVSTTNHNRILNRGKEDESINDVVGRLLDETATQLIIEEVVDRVMEVYGEESVACIRTTFLPDIENPSTVHLAVHSSEAETLGGPIEEFERSEEYQVYIGDYGPFQLSTEETSMAPQDDSDDSITLYETEDILGAEPKSLEEGYAELMEELMEDA